LAISQLDTADLKDAKALLDELTWTGQRSLSESRCGPGAWDPETPR
jgi:hypothetical protein